MANNDRVADLYYGRIHSAETQAACRDRIHWLCERVTGKHVLDLGCSQGVSTLILAREGCEVIGLDIEPEPLEVARQALKAKEEFERLVRRFPRDDYANRARKSIRRCLISLAEYELYVGHYYFKMGKYRAAMDRYSYIIKNYPDLGQYNEALEYIRICKENLMEEQK